MFQSHIHIAQSFRFANPKKGNQFKLMRAKLNFAENFQFIKLGKCAIELYRIHLINSCDRFRRKKYRWNFSIFSAMFFYRSKEKNFTASCDTQKNVFFFGFLTLYWLEKFIDCLWLCFFFLIPSFICGRYFIEK